MSILEKVFEIVVCNRLTFVNEAFGKIDETNGAYLKRRRTSDNLFVQNGLIERQLILGKSLYICYVDFTKAFDLIYRHILFNKIVNLGWYGKVINIVRNLYSKTYFRVKCNGKISCHILVVCNRLTFVNEAFGKIDETNGAYLKRRRTSDNLFVLNGLIERQLILGKSLYICYVDFTKAFDLIYRHIVFNKIINLGWYGIVINTVINLYSKTYFRVKCNGKIGCRILDTLGVNQGDSGSGFLFRKYIYLHQ